MAASLPKSTPVSSDVGLDALLQREWLRSNELGSYAAQNLLAGNSRRYHGLLVAATLPPVKRIVALGTVMEQLIIGKKTYDLATNEFIDAVCPDGQTHFHEYRDDEAATFVYRIGKTTLRKRVLLSDTDNALAIRYDITGPADKLLLRPFTPLRDFHSLRTCHNPDCFAVEPADAAVTVTGEDPAVGPLHIEANRGHFKHDPQWWYQVLYRHDISRGQDGTEDIFSPGLFVWKPQDGKKLTLTARLCCPSLPQPPAKLKWKTARKARRQRKASYAEPFPTDDRTTRRLACAAASFPVRRISAGGGDGASILAGFPWFADWGRDTFIALPGLLLCTGQIDLARKVFRTYADALSEGMIPNRFDDYGGLPHYNSADASLWFIIAAARYVETLAEPSQDRFLDEVLLPCCCEIVDHYAAGTRFNIHADGDGLLHAGSPDTQLTWMDAKLGEAVITSRWGKAVELNAMWHSAHCMLAEWLRPTDPDRANHYARQAAGIASRFVEVFWNPQFGWLNDVVNAAGADASLRPNQVFAVSLPHSPLSTAQQRAILNIVRDELLTPTGLRTLSPRDHRYRRRYGGSWESRERAYHQGTVWPWLIGGFIEGWLKVHPDKAGIDQAEQWLEPLGQQLDAACLGQLNEIHDGGAPHAPRGCFAQAWSVAEVLRARCLVTKARAACD